MNRYDFADTVGFIMIAIGVIGAIAMVDSRMLMLSFFGFLILVTTSLLDDETNK